MVFVEKTLQDRDLSYPKNLIAFAKEKRCELIETNKFEPDRDIMIVTFDLDIFKNKVKHLEELFQYQDEHLIFGVAYPSFELFLLLHIEDSVERILLPNRAIILKNEKLGSQRPCQIYLREVTNQNPKTNEHIGDLAYHIDIAIKQEKKINQDLSNCLNDITSNIALLIEKIKQEQLPYE